MTTPATAIKDAVRVLIGSNRDIGQPKPLTSSQLREFHSRSQKLKMLCQELNRIGAMLILSGRFERAL
jgi:hypothetical protein